MNTHFENNKGHYIHQTTYTQRERMVGFFVFVGFILFLFFIIIGVKNEHLFDKRITYYIHVDSSEGLGQGSIVKAFGIEVGRVADLTLSKEGNIRVAVEIYERRQRLITVGAKALVNRLTSIGSALIEIKSDSIDAPILPAGSIIPVYETASLNDLIFSVAHLIQAADSQKLLGKVDTILPKLEQTLGNIHTITKQIASGKGTLGATVFDRKVEKNLKVVVKSGAKILSEAENIVAIAKQRLLQIEPVLNNAHFIVSDVREALQSLPKLVQELREIITQANTALTLINGELSEISGTTIEVKHMLSKTDRLLDNVQNTWPLSKDVETLNQQPLIPLHINHE